MTAPLVYVNFGMPDDYKELARRGIDVKGKIVIVRYGSGWRGLKPSSRRSTAPSAASSIPIRTRTVTSKVTHIRRAASVRRKACSVAPCSICRSRPAIR